MKRSEFVPGVLFMMPGRSENGKVYFVESIGEEKDGAIGFRKHGLIYNGKFIRLDEYEFHHFEFTSKGIRLWDVVDTVYLYSKIIPFESLRKVELPIPATNPVTI